MGMAQQEVRELRSSSIHLLIEETATEKDCGVIGESLKDGE